MQEKRRGMLVVVSGPSGTGKGTLCNMLLEKDPSLRFSVSVTTRKRRDYEVEGVHYYFVTDEQYDELLREDALLEHATVHANRYGTPRKPIEELMEKGLNVILDIDVIGAMKVRALCPDATLVFLIPPTWEDLETRIHNSKFIPENEIIERLDIAKEEVLCAEQYDYILINDTVEDTVRRLAQIIHGNRYSRSSMKSFLKSYIESEIKSELVDVIRSL